MRRPWVDVPRGARVLALDVAIALAFALVAIPVHMAQGPWQAAAVAVLAGAMATRRVAVVAMIVLAVVAAVLQLIGGDIAYLADAAYAVLFFTLGNHPDRRLRRFGLAASGVAVVVAAGWSAWVMAGQRDDLFPDAAYAAVAIGAVTAVVTMGGWVAGLIRYQRRQAAQAEIAAQLNAVERRRLNDAVKQEHERAAIATDMHDVVAHSWAVVAAQADGARYALRTSPEQAEQALTVIAETARSAMTDLRVIVAQLRNQQTAETVPGAVRTQQLFERLRASGMRIEHEQTGTPNASPLVALTAHRMLGEALTNALKHGDLDRPVRVDEDWTDGYRLEVVNAVPPTPIPAVGTGHGIIGMTERATIAGGWVTSVGEDGHWVLRAYLPIREETR